MVSASDVAMRTSPAFCLTGGGAASQKNVSRHAPRICAGFRRVYRVRTSWMAKYRDRLTESLSEQLNRVSKLVIAHVRRRSKPQHVSTCVAAHATLAQSSRDVGCLVRANRQKAPATLVRHRFDERDR